MRYIRPVYLVCGILGQVYLVSHILGQMYLVCGMLGLVCLVFGILGRVHLVKSSPCLTVRPRKNWVKRIFNPRNNGILVPNYL